VLFTEIAHIFIWFFMPTGFLIRNTKSTIPDNNGKRKSLIVYLKLGLCDDAAIRRMPERHMKV
jgi:hypothetical protein